MFHLHKRYKVGRGRSRWVKPPDRRPSSSSRVVERGLTVEGAAGRELEAPQQHAVLDVVEAHVLGGAAREQVGAVRAVAHR
eukprot:8229955-Pyramimonas_sp.AAC.1